MNHDLCVEIVEEFKKYIDEKLAEAENFAKETGKWLMEDEVFGDLLQEPDEK